MKKIDLNEIIDDIEKVSFYSKDKEDNIIKTPIESSLIKRILDIVNSKQINIVEKQKLFKEIISIVCEIKAENI